MEACAAMTAGAGASEGWGDDEPLASEMFFACTSTDAARDARADDAALVVRFGPW